MSYRIQYQPDDCFYEVISPLGVVVTRTVTREQAIEFLDFQGVENDGEETPL